MNNVISGTLEKWLGIAPIRKENLYLVGGTVRDLLLGHFPKDIDLVCRNAKKVASDISKRNNASLVSMEKKPHEPCYRIVDRDNPDEFLDIAGMRGNDILEDLKNRDFTMNAMAVEIRGDGTAGELIDPVHGAEDIREKMIRMVSDRALVSDPLRILRAIRHAATLNFSIDDATLREMQSSAGLLTCVSAERILTELLLILASRRGALHFRKMDALGILEVLFPEIMPMKVCDQNGYHHKDVWGHSLLVMEKVEGILNDLPEYFGGVSGEIADNLSSGRIPLLKLASLFHDIGKPVTKGQRPDTRITFYGHDKAGADIIRHIAERLRMPNRSRDLMVSIVREHLKPLVLSRPETRRTSLIRWFRRLRDDAVPVLILGMADIMSSLGPASGVEYRNGVIAWIQESMYSYFSSLRQKIEAPLLITGDDLISMGMEPGIALGNLLYRLRFAQDTGKITSREEALHVAREMLFKRSEARKQSR
jgi:putative nucleotidyltransferase with HDIG domain